MISIKMFSRCQIKISPASICDIHICELLSTLPVINVWRKPCHSYNPVLGEFFCCRYDYPNSTQGFYIAEQGKPLIPQDYVQISPPSRLEWLIQVAHNFCTYIMSIVISGLVNHQIGSDSDMGRLFNSQTSSDLGSESDFVIIMHADYEAIQDSF